MYYPKNKNTYSLEEFANPSKEYRAAPFWAWNTNLDKDELMRQIDIFKQMGFGGYHIHSRTGMATPYLSDEYFQLVGDCVQKGKQNDMLTYLYDEDRWPSGTAGGKVTKSPEFRQTYLLFQTHFEKNDRNHILACFDIELDENYEMLSCVKISENDQAKHQKWYAIYEVIESGNCWFNNECFADLLNPKAVARFIELTHEQYKKHFSDEFQKAIPSIFTDEPQETRKNLFDNRYDDFMMPWTASLQDEYIKTYGVDILDNLPEIFFNKKGEKVSVTRYNFHEITTELFATAFSDQIGMWCKENGISLTGHIMNEGSILSQTIAVGDPLRHYRHFTYPGIDMLCAYHEFCTVKQVESMRRQKGAEGVLCELDGVTNWDFDFRNHKIHGDWQAALGVTLRVPHLSWVSMNGEAKRDYPASINYQAAWCDKYHIIEDYFGRISSILTRGKSVCKVAVLHPVRNIWATLGTTKGTKSTVDKLNRDFLDMCQFLVKNHIDFDYISESNLVYQNAGAKDGKFAVENCEYDVVLIPELITIKSSTLEILDSANKNGVRIVSFGDAPEYIDAVKSDTAKGVFANFENHENTLENVAKAIERYRDVEIVENGKLSDEYCYQLKADDEQKWLFIAKAVDPQEDDTNIHNLTITIDGEYEVCEYNCMQGKIYKVDFEKANGKTVVKMPVYSHDSIMLKLSAKADESATSKTFTNTCENVISKTEVDYKLHEPNAYLIDRASMKLDDGEFEHVCDILRKDNEFRKRIGFKQKGEGVEQPWLNPNKPKAVNSITLKAKFESKIEYNGALLGLENAEHSRIYFNGEEVKNTPTGYYVDKCIKTVNLGTIKQGTNEIVVTIPFDNTSDTEAMYILGDFGVYDTVCPYIDVLPEKLKFGDISSQGLLFYGGNIDYYIGNLDAKKICVDDYKGGLIEVLDGGKPLGEIVCPPYTVDIENANNLILRYFGTRVNTFGQLHLTTRGKNYWYGPFSWRTSGSEWDDNYLPWEQGIVSPPKTN